jgi:predicted amidohydrolase
LHLALASLAPVWEEKAGSLERCCVLAARAASRGVALLVFPEMTLTGFTMKATSVAELARYAKLHLFSPAGEEACYERGERTAVAVVDDVVFGLSICYDLRFPEPYGAVAEQVHAHLLLANWPESRIAHWHALLQARAIESQCWMVGVNRAGEDGNGLRYPPSSHVFDPAGVHVTPDWTDGELDGYSISEEAVLEQRRRFPVLRDRRPAVYRDMG